MKLPVIKRYYIKPAARGHGFSVFKRLLIGGDTIGIAVRWFRLKKEARAYIAEKKSEETQRWAYQQLFAKRSSVISRYTAIFRVFYKRFRAILTSTLQVAKQRYTRD
jgi:hypothetical protein